MEEDITYPLKCLKDGIDRIKRSKSVAQLVLAVHNSCSRLCKIEKSAMLVFNC
jgi:hypothetical protein